MILYSSELGDQRFLVFTCTDTVVYEHEHSFLELAYVLQGTATHTVNGITSQVTQGDYFLIDYGWRHHYKQLGTTPLQVLNCLFLPQFISETLYRCHSLELLLGYYQINTAHYTHKHAPNDFCFHDEDGRVATIMKQLQQEYIDNGCNSQELMRCLLIQLLILSTRQLASPKVKAENDDMVHCITAHVQKNFSQKLSLQKITAEYPYSLGFISRRFKDQIGISFQEYVQNVRIQESCRLLVESNKKIAEIATLVGYENIKFFGQVFRNHIGMTPREYRAAYAKR